MVADRPAVAYPESGGMAMATTTPRLTITPLHPCLGARVEGVDLTGPVEDDTFRQIRAAFDEHSVLVFHQQRFTDPTQMAFAGRFGPLETTIRSIGHEDRVDPRIVHLSNADPEHETRLLGWTDRPTGGWSTRPATSSGTRTARSSRCRPTPRCCRAARSRPRAARRSSPACATPGPRCPTRGGVRELPHAQVVQDGERDRRDLRDVGLAGAGQLGIGEVGRGGRGSRDGRAG